MDELYVITTISNPLGYASRYKRYQEFCRHIENSGAVLYTVELAFGDQPFAVTIEGNPRHVQLRSPHQIWYKENLINVALKRLPQHWKFVAWLDADIAFVRADWADETLRQLEQHRFVQMFTHAIDLGPAYEPLKTYEGFVYRHREGTAGSKGHGQMGYAWAARRADLEAVGGLIDWSILGSNDYFMALALIGKVDANSGNMPHSIYAATLLDWQEKCQRHIGGDIGCVENSLVHFWHGRRADRGYTTRWQILVDHEFDPGTDLVRDEQGLLGLSGAKPGLRDDIAAYFWSRNEDNVDL